MPTVIGKDTTVYKQITCRKCGSINQYAPNEVRELSKGKDISGCMCVTQGFNCAGCGQEVITYSD